MELTERQLPALVDKTALGPRPKSTPVWITSSITRGILEVIRAGVGEGLGPRLALTLQNLGVWRSSSLCSKTSSLGSYTLSVRRKRRKAARKTWN